MALKTETLQLSYAIGLAQPVSILVDTFGTGRLPDAQIAAGRPPRGVRRFAGRVETHGFTGAALA